MELWDAYDALGRRTGETLVRGEQVPRGRYHLVVHIWYQNEHGDLLVQRRALSRELAPGIWACTGGSAIRGETIEQALVRESNEEMGIDPDVEKSVRVLSYTQVDAITHVFLVPYTGDAKSLRLQEEEVMDAKWISQEELRACIGRPEYFWQYRYLDLLLMYLQENPATGEPAQLSPV